MSEPQGNPTEDLVTRLREFDWYGPPRKGADELLNEAANEIEKLRKALQPFADAHHEAMSFMARCGENHNAMEARDLYMWWAPRTLSVVRFTNAAKALEGKP